MKHTERFSKSTSSVIVLWLIIVFLGLGSCSVKKAFQTLLGSPALSQDSGKGRIAAACNGVEKSVSQDLSLPLPVFTFTPPLLPADFLSSSPDFGIVPLSGKQRALHPGSRSLLPFRTVPIYLRNRSLLI